MRPRRRLTEMRLETETVARSQLKNLGGANTLTLSEHQYFVWETSPQSTKRQDILEIWGNMAPFPLATPMDRGY